MLQVERPDFTSNLLYYDSPQGIGYNATISTPQMHAYALEYLESYCFENRHILSVGSGSGYLTVALSKMINDTGFIVDIEHIDALNEKSKENISKYHSNYLKMKN